jgi:hypothetical protein
MQQRSGATAGNNGNFPGILNHPLMRKFGEIDHKTLETRMLWITPTAVPFMHLAIDDKDEKWGLFARDEMALLVGGAIFLGTQFLTHKLFNHMGWFMEKGINKDKGDFLAYAIGHAAALAHGAFTAMWFGRWADKMFVHPVNPNLPVQDRISHSLLRTKPAQWLRNAGINLPTPPPSDLPQPVVGTSTKNDPVAPPLQPTTTTQTTTKNSIVPFNSPTVTTKQRSGQAINTASFSSKWVENFHANTGGTGWAKAQKFSGYFAAVLLLPALRWNQYVTKDQHLDPEEAKRKRLELASRDFATLFGGNMLYFSIWITGLSLLEYKYPEIPTNYRQNIAYVFGDLAKTLNAGIFAVVFSKWLTARKEKKRLLMEEGHQEKVANAVAVQKNDAVKKNSPIPTEYHYFTNKVKDHFSSAKHFHA